MFQGKRTYAFLTLPNYSLIALANALEPLRMANRVANRTLYEWQIASLRGEPVIASSGLQMTPTVALADIGKVDVLFVCGGINVREAVTAPLTKALRRRAETGGALGALCTGGYVLARAGLLNRYKASIHWENVHSLREEFPLVEIRPYRVHKRLATRWRDRRLLIAGDAAHLNNPKGGMGMNGGIHDAMCLREHLVRALDGALAQLPARPESR